MTTITAPKTYAVKISFLLPRHDKLIIELSRDLIRLREPHARRWLSFPLSRLYYLAAELEAHSRRSKT